MKVTVPIDAARLAVDAVAACAANKSPKPEVECVRLRAEDGALVLDATDLDVAMRLPVASASVIESGAVLVNAARLKAALSTIRAAGDVVLATEKDALRIEGEGDDSTALMTFPAGDYPDLADGMEDDEFAVPGAALATALRRLSVFADPAESRRYAIGGVFVYTQQEPAPRVVMVATDGVRLAESVITLDAKPREVKGILSLKTCGIVAPHAEPVEVVKVALSDRRVCVRAGEALIVGRLIDGTFPDYEATIPGPGKQRFSALVGDLIDAIRRAAVVHDVSESALVLSPADGAVRVTSRSAEGRVATTCPAEIDGWKDPIRLWSPKLLGPLRTMSKDSRVTFWIKDARSPVLWTNGGDDYRAVQMTLAMEPV